MSLTRKMLKAMGIEDEKIDQIIEAHTETVDSLKDRAEQAEAAAKDVPELQKKLEAAKSALAEAQKDDWKSRHDAVKKQFDDYKAEQASKETKAAKETAVRAYLESKNIKDGNLTIAMRGLGAEIDALELDGDKIKDTAALDALIAGDYKGLVTVTSEHNAPPPANPPAGTGANGSTGRAKAIAAKYYEDLYGVPQKKGD